MLGIQVAKSDPDLLALDQKRQSWISKRRSDMEGGEGDQGKQRWQVSQEQFSGRQPCMSELALASGRLSLCPFWDIEENNVAMNTFA
jgi:hypothetical protein